MTKPCAMKYFAAMEPYILILDSNSKVKSILSPKT